MRGACRSATSSSIRAVAHARETSPVAITSTARSAPRSPCARARARARATRPHAACNAAVPVRTGIRSRPVAVRMRSSGRIASGHAINPNSPHWVSPTESSMMNTTTPTTIVDERAHDAGAVPRPRPPVAQPHGERSLAARLVRRDVAEVVGHQDRDGEQAHHHAAPPGGRGHRLHHHVRRAARRHQPEEQEHHQLAEPEAGVGPRPARIQERGQQARARRPPGSGPASWRGPVRARRRPRVRGRASAAVSTARGDAAPLATSRGGPIRSAVSTPRTPSK